MAARTNLDRRFLKGEDLTSCTQKFADERSTRTLTLRRSNFVKIAGLIAGKGTLKDDHRVKLNHEEVLSILKSGNESRVAEFAERLTKLAETDQTAIKDFANSEHVSALFQALSEATSESLRLTLMRALQVVFPLLGDQQSYLIDEGLVSLASDFLELPTVSVVAAAMDLIGIIARSSTWGRDTILCCGVQDLLINIAMTTDNEGVCVKACAALAHVFEDCDLDMADTVIATAESAIPLLKIQSVAAMRWVLQMFNNMACIGGTISLLLDLSVHVEIVKLLSVENLKQQALMLIGHLADGEPFKVQEMVDCGLVPVLFSLLESEFTALALQVMSSLVETLPDVFVPIATPKMAKDIVDIAQVASYDIRKECVFLLATMLQFLPPSALRPLINSDVMDELSEMCSCGNGRVVMRCLGALMRVCLLSRATGNMHELVAVMLSTEFADRLNELVSCENKCVAQAALALQSMLVE